MTTSNCSEPRLIQYKRNRILRRLNVLLTDLILLCRIVRNRASENARKGPDGGSPVSEGVTPHGSPTGQGGTYSINAIMGLQGTPPLTDHNGNGAKRKHDETGT